MAGDNRWTQTTLSGLTRSEQRVLLFLIGMIGLGLGYQYFQDGWRQDRLVLRRADGNDPGTARGSIPDTEVRAQGEALLLMPGLVDLNTATAADLESLPEIGPVKAASIVAYREKHGPFLRPADLESVSGIGDKTVEAIRPFLRPIESSTSETAAEIAPLATAPESVPPPDTEENEAPVNINEAGLEELKTIKGIGDVLAARIIEYRQRNGPFRSPKDIRNVFGIGSAVLRDNPGRIVVDSAEGGSHMEKPGR